MTDAGFPRKRRWSSPEIAIWLSALLAVVTVGVLVATDVVGSWALLIGSGIVVAVGLLGYRGEDKDKKGS